MVSHAVTFLLAMCMIIVPLVERQIFLAYYEIVTEPQRGVRYTSAFMLGSAMVGILQPLFFFSCLVAYPLVRQRYWARRYHQRCLAAEADYAQAALRRTPSSLVRGHGSGASALHGPLSVGTSGSLHNLIDVMGTSLHTTDSHAHPPHNDLLVPADSLPPVAPSGSRAGRKSLAAAGATGEQPRASSASEARADSNTVRPPRRRVSRCGDPALSLTDSSDTSPSAPSPPPTPPLSAPALAPQPMRSIVWPPTPSPPPAHFEPPPEQQDAAGSSTTVGAAGHSVTSNPFSGRCTSEAHAMSLSRTALASAVRSGGPAITFVQSPRRQHQSGVHPSFYVLTVPPTPDGGVATKALAAGYDDGGARDGSDSSNPSSPLAPGMEFTAAELPIGPATAIEPGELAGRLRPLPLGYHGVQTLTTLLNSERASSTTVSATATATTSTGTGTATHSSGTATSSMKQSQSHHSSPKQKSANHFVHTPLTAVTASPSLFSRTQLRYSHFPSEGGASISVRNMYTDGSSFALSKRSMMGADPTVAPTAMGSPAASVQEGEGEVVMAMSREEVQVPVSAPLRPRPSSASSSPDRSWGTLLLRWLPWRAVGDDSETAAASSGAAQAATSSPPTDGNVQRPGLHTTQRPASRATTSLPAAVLRHYLNADGVLHFAQTAYFWVAATGILITYVFGIIWILIDELSALGDVLTMAEGWNYVIYRSVPTTVDEKLCKVELARRCSGGSALCNATSYANTTAAHAARCPFCPPEQQAAISSFTRLCSVAYQPGSHFGTTFLVLLATCVTASLVALCAAVFSSGTGVLPTLPYVSALQREKEAQEAASLLVREGSFAVPGAATVTASTLAQPTARDEEMRVPSVILRSAAATTGVASSPQTPTAVAQSRAQLVHTFEGLHAPTAALLPPLSVIMAEMPASVGGTALAQGAVAASPLSRSTGDSSSRRSSEGRGDAPQSLVEGVDDALNPLQTVGDNAAASMQH